MTMIFKEYLADQDAVFASSVGVSSNASWEALNASIAAGGEEGILASLLTQPYSISYLPYNRERLKDEAEMVTLRTASGEKIRASYAASQAAMNSMATQFASTNSSVVEPNKFTIKVGSATAAGAWPILGLSYLVIRREADYYTTGEYHEHRSIPEHAAGFFDWFYQAKSIQPILELRGLASLPHQLTRQVQEHYWANWFCQGTPIRPAFSKKFVVVGPEKLETVTTLMADNYLGAYGDNQEEPVGPSPIRSF
jgi:ABC-type phosphate transport system substrate-binding protein